MVAIGTRRGHIRFYDQDMNILYWYQQAALDAVVSLSFNLDTPDGDTSWIGSRISFPTGGQNNNNKDSNNMNNSITLSPH